MAKILVVEDEPHMRMGLKDNLEFESYEVEMAEDGERGLALLIENSYDLVLLDVMLPKLSGLEVCKAARKKGIEIPIIFLTAKSEEIDKVLGLEIGGDDYVTKPFGLRELLARVKAALRRGGSLNDNSGGEEHNIGRLKVNFHQFTAQANESPVHMSHKEYELLEYLITHKNKAVSRSELLEEIWGYDTQPTTRTVDNFILRLRQKVEKDTNDPRIILTVHGVGYKLVH